MKIKEGQEKEYNKFVDVNSHDGYSKATVDFMCRWAELMEEMIASGEKIPDIAGKTSHDADTEGITGFMYGCAVNALAKFWEHGETLRKWHNKSYGYDGDGCVNPAILTIGVR